MMSGWAKISNDAIDRLDKVGMTAFCVLAVLCRHANGNGEAWPSIRTIAEIVGITERAVQKSITALLEVGMIERTIRTTKSGANLANCYTIILSPDGEGEPRNTLPHGRVNPGTRVNGHSGEGEPRVLFDNISTRNREQGRKSSLKSEIVFPEILQTTKFKEAWSLWEAVRREKGNTLKPTAIKLQLKHCEEIGHDRAVAMVLHSAKMQYTGLYEPKINDNGNGHATPSPAPKRKQLTRD